MEAYRIPKRKPSRSSTCSQSEQQIDHVHHRTWLPKLCKAEATAESSQAESSSSDHRGRRWAEVGAGELEGQVKPETLEASLVSLPARGGAIHRNPAHITCCECFLECSRFPDRPGFLVESPSCLACPAPPFPDPPLAITSSPPPIAGLLDLESCRRGYWLRDREEACEGFCGLQSCQEFPALEGVAEIWCRLQVCQARGRVALLQGPQDCKVGLCSVHQMDWTPSSVLAAVCLIPLKPFQRPFRVDWSSWLEMMWVRSKGRTCSGARGGCHG